MNDKLYVRVSAVITSALLLLGFVGGAAFLSAQAPSRFVGSVIAITGSTLTVKTDTGDTRQFDVPPSTAIKRIAPGEKDLSKAVNLAFADLAVGDRVFVRLNTAGTAPTPQATQIIVVKAEDIAQKQQQDREAWLRNGVAGLVKTVDPNSGVITLTTGAGASAKTVLVHITRDTILKRYAPTSVRYDQARPAPLDAIHPGDQLRARGEKAPDGSEITAAEVVSGSFRNISGTIASLDAAQSTFTIKDLATKKMVTVHVTPEAQMRRLPERMAQMLAIRLKGGSPGAGGGPSQGGGQHTWNGGGGPSGGTGSGLGSSPGGRPGTGDLQQMLNRAPAIQFSDLQKSEAVMLVATEGTNDVTAITLLAGVEPLLEAPAASQDLLSNWSMGSGGAEAGGATP